MYISLFLKYDKLFVIIIYSTGIFNYIYAFPNIQNMELVISQTEAENDQICNKLNIKNHPNFKSKFVHSHKNCQNHRILLALNPQVSLRFNMNSKNESHSIGKYKLTEKRIFLRLTDKIISLSNDLNETIMVFRFEGGESILKFCILKSSFVSSHCMRNPLSVKTSNFTEFNKNNLTTVVSVTEHVNIMNMKTSTKEFNSTQVVRSASRLTVISTSTSKSTIGISEENELDDIIWKKYDIFELNQNGILEYGKSAKINSKKLMSKALEGAYEKIFGRLGFKYNVTIHNETNERGKIKNRIWYDYLMQTKLTNVQDFLTKTNARSGKLNILYDKVKFELDAKLKENLSLVSHNQSKPIIKVLRSNTNSISATLQVASILTTFLILFVITCYCMRRRSISPELIRELPTLISSGSLRRYQVQYGTLTSIRNLTHLTSSPEDSFMVDEKPNLLKFTTIQPPIPEKNPKNLNTLS
ncbi:hypothetical protein SNEBB_005992 [Seison nebaliae]|nr:hypothetical protein SNEBB_005992 [Seison nebaliae]